MVERHRVVSVPAPPQPWYEHIPTWVSISLFLHGLALLLLVVCLSSPGTFGIASEDAVNRVDAVRAAETDELRLRLAGLEQRVTQTGGGTAVQSGDVSQRLVLLEGRIAALCARATPPCQ